MTNITESDRGGDYIKTEIDEPMNGIFNNSTVLVPEVDFDWDSTNRIIYRTEIVLQLMFLIIGLAGNTLSIVILTSRKWANIKSRYVLIALAVSDTTMIINHTFNQQFVQNVFGLDVRGLSDVGCKLFFIVYRSSKITSSWLCIERFIAVTMPLQYKTIVTVLRTKVFIFLNYFVVILFTTGLNYASTGIKEHTCSKDLWLSTGKATKRSLVLFEMAMYSVIPICIMSVLAPYIVYKLFNHYKNSKRLITSEERQKQHFNELIQTTIVLISIIVAFVIFVTPITVFQQIKFWSNIKGHDGGGNLSVFLLQEISQRLEQINYSTNFFFYILSNAQFRQCLLKLNCKKRSLTSVDQTFSDEITKTRNGETQESALSGINETHADKFLE